MVRSSKRYSPSSWEVRVAEEVVTSYRHSGSRDSLCSAAFLFIWSRTPVHGIVLPSLNAALPSDPGLLMAPVQLLPHLCPHVI